MKTFFNHPPHFWFSASPTIPSCLLAPFGWLYGQVGRIRKGLACPQAVSVPVICVGNLGLGGAGKTPVVLALQKILSSSNICFLTRGYKGRLKGPIKVSLSQHSALEVGDEPLLLAKHASTWVARNRRQGAQAAIAEGAKLLLMDDGFQNFELQKNLSFLVIDTQKGFGNGKVFPAGPLREPLKDGLQRADAFVLVGSQNQELEAFLGNEKPFFRVQYVYFEEEISLLKHKPLLAFAGLAFPEKFFQGLRDQSLSLIQAIPFPDHHAYTADEEKELLREAREHKAFLVTTEKDAMRLSDSLKKIVKVVKIEARFEDESALRTFLRAHHIPC